MRLGRLRLRNIGPHRELDIEFGPGINGIVGSNGCGKSTVLDAITIAIVNESRQPGGRADNVTWGESRGAISLDFHHGDGSYTVERYLGRKPGQKLVTPRAEYTKAAEINEQLELILGTTMQALLDNVFIPQKRIEAVFSDQRGVRLREIQRTVGLARAQKAWEALGDEISDQQLTVGLEEQITSTRGSLENAEAEELALRDRLSELDTEIRDLLPARVLVQRADERRRTSAAIQQAEREAREAASQLKTALADLERAQAEHEAARNTAESGRQAAESARESLLRYRADQRAWEQAKRLLEELRAIEQDLGRTPPPDRSRMDEIYERGAKIQATLQTRTQQLEGKAPRPEAPGEAELRKEAAAVEQRWLNFKDAPTPDEEALRRQLDRARVHKVELDQGVCPTCGQDAPEWLVQQNESSLADLQAQYAEAKRDRELANARLRAELEAQMAETRTKLEGIEKAARVAISKSIEKLSAEHDRLAAEWKELNEEAKRWDALSARAQALRDQMPDVGDEPEPVDERALQTKVELFDRVLLRVQELSTQVQLHDQAATQAGDRAARAREALAALSVEGGEEIDEETEADARRQVSLLEAREEARRRLVEELTSAEIRAREYRAQLGRLLEREQLEARQRRWTVVCRRAREALHTSALPSLIMGAYARLLNERMASYLHAWEAPFRLWLDDEQLEFIAEKEEGYPIPADRLSGGEEVVGATSYRVGMADTFARQVGLLVLDEPTNHLDKNNIVHLQRLLLRLKELAGATGRQILIVTHEESLMGFFDHSITLTSGSDSP